MYYDELTRQNTEQRTRCRGRRAFSARHSAFDSVGAMMATRKKATESKPRRPLDCRHSEPSALSHSERSEESLRSRISEGSDPTVPAGRNCRVRPSKSLKGRPALAKLELRAPGINLRPAQFTDADGLYRHIRDKEVARYTIGIPYPYPRDGVTAFLKGAIKAMKAGQRYLFVIRRYDADEPMGTIDLMLPPKLRCAELGYWLGKEFWNKGIMTQAVKAALKFAFETLKLHRVHVSHLDGNDASRRVIEKCWVRREGIDRELVFKHKQWFNVIRYGLLEQEYRGVLHK